MESDFTFSLESGNLSTEGNSNSTDPEIEYFLEKFEAKCFLVAVYGFVFICSCVGNLAVILIILLSKGMRNRTNLLLLNLAFADFGVSIFCVLQNLSLYLSHEWLLGDTFCKLYHFFQALSYTSSAVFLVLMSVEKYAAIIHPIWSKRWVTKSKIIVAVIGSWSISSLYCCPRLIMFGTVDVTSLDPQKESDSICILKQHLYSSKHYDLFTFFACFLIPMVIMSILYTIIAIKLWKPNPLHEVEFRDRIQGETHGQALRLLEKRRKVIKLLVAIVFTFIVCTFPFYFRKIWQHFYPHFQGSSEVAIMRTIATNLLLYANSALNPFLYALFSVKFRDLIGNQLCCRREAQQLLTTELTSRP